MSYTDGSAGVLSEDMCGQTVDSIVGKLDDFLFTLEFENNTDVTKDLLPHDLHIGANVSENGRVNEVALIAQSFATNNEARSLFLARLDIRHDAVELSLRNLGAMLSTRREGVACFPCKSFGVAGECCQHAIIGAFLNENTGTRHTDLACVETIDMRKYYRDEDGREREELTRSHSSPT